MLARVWHPGVVLADYWVSEKYDGVRGWWDGSRLLTRGGRVVAAPAWFTAGWPPVPLDGELWAGRGRFEAAQSAVAGDRADEAAWRGMRYMVFDAPAAPGPFTDRIAALRRLVAGIGAPWVQPVEQSRVADEAALRALLKRTVQAGGEGLVLHRADSAYRGERSDDLLKFKPYDDAEATVVGHLPGRGRLAGRLGALVVETPAGLRFRLGSGLSDALRADPPPIGSHRHLSLCRPARRQRHPALRPLHARAQGRIGRPQQ